MASSILIIAVLLFALRGLLLGFSGVIGRLLGFALGYLVADHYRDPLADFISLNTSIGLPAVALQIISGLGLFIVTLFFTGLIVAMLFKLLGRVIPIFKMIADNHSIGGKIAGATLNGAIATAVVLLGLWGFGKVTQQQDPDDRLQHIANQFGDKVFGIIADNNDFNVEHFSQSFSQTTSNGQVTRSTSAGYSSFGSTDTNSSSRTNIDSVIELLQQYNQNGNGINTAELLNNPQLQELINNPEQLQHIQQQIINNPQLQELMQRLQSQQP